MLRTLLCLAITLGGLLASSGSATAQNPVRPVIRPGVFQMEIFNGASRTVAYYPVNLSPGEVGSVKELERLENESAYAQDLLALKRQYVASEQVMEPYRRTVQQQLYGRSVDVVNYSSIALGGWGYGGYGFGSYGYPYYRAGYGIGYSGAFASAYLGSMQSEYRSLANGIGDEGTVKSAFAQTLAQQATPMYAASVARDYDRAVAAAAASPALQVALGLPPVMAKPREGGAIGEAGFDASPKEGVVVHLRDGKVIRGMDAKPDADDKEFVLVELKDGGTTSVRKSEVARIDRGKKS